MRKFDIYLNLIPKKTSVLISVNKKFFYNVTDDYLKKFFSKKIQGKQKLYFCVFNNETEKCERCPDNEKIVIQGGIVCFSLESQKFCFSCIKNYFVFNSVLRILSSIILCLNNGFLLHSAGIAEDNGCVLYSGKSGSGKSTLAKKFDNKKVLSDELCPVVLINKNIYSWPSMFYSEVRPGFVNGNNLIKIKEIKFLSEIDKGKIINIKKKEDFIDLLLTNIFWLPKNKFLTQRQINIAEKVAEQFF